MTSASVASGYDALIARARAGEPILIDGGTGSECFRRGVPMVDHGWSGAAALTHPDIVRAIHDDYLAIGADLIVANTFATGRNILRDVGADEDFESLNHAAVRLAVEARNGAAATTVVGAGISNWSFSDNRPSLDQLEADTRAQAAIMRDAGAEVLTLEMMVDLPRMRVTLSAATSVGLPVWVGFSIGPEGGIDLEELRRPIELREGGLLTDAVALAASHDVDALCVMHTDVRLAEAALTTVRANWDGPLGVYAHASAWKDGIHTHDGVVSPVEYVAYVPAWRAAGATMVGGCCGIGPNHLRLVADELRGG